MTARRQIATIVIKNGRKRCKSSKYVALIGRDHVFDVDERIFSTMHLEYFERFLNQITDVLSLSLVVINLVADIPIFPLENVEYGKDLPVVWDQCFTDHLTTK